MVSIDTILGKLFVCIELIEFVYLLVLYILSEYCEVLRVIFIKRVLY